MTRTNPGDAVGNHYEAGADFGIKIQLWRLRVSILPYEFGHARFAEHRTLLTASSIVAALQYLDTD